VSKTRPALARAVVASVCIVSLVHAGTLVPRFFRLSVSSPEAGVLNVVLLNAVLVSAIAGCLLALLLVAKAWSEPGAQSLAVFLAAAVAAWTAILQLGRFFGEADPVLRHMGSTPYSPTSFRVAGQGGAVEFIILPFSIAVAAAAFLRFSATYPRRLQPEDLPVPKRLHWLRKVDAALLRPLPVWALGLLTPSSCDRINSGLGTFRRKLHRVGRFGGLRRRTGARRISILSRWRDDSGYAEPSRWLPSRRQAG
jgi:hypothetical protein